MEKTNIIYTGGKRGEWSDILLLTLSDSGIADMSNRSIFTNVYIILRQTQMKE